MPDHTPEIAYIEHGVNGVRLSRRALANSMRLPSFTTRSTRARRRPRPPWARVPPRLTTYLGILFGLFGLGLLIHALRSFFLGDVVPGWTSVLAAVVILGSLQLIMLGVLGEYLGRLYIEAKRRPLFVIERVVRSDEFAPTVVRPEATSPPSAGAS